MKYKNLQIIGTSHIAVESIEKVKTFIEESKPDIIALELDKPRLYSILNKRKRKVKFKDIKKIGISGLFFNLIGAWLEKKMGKLVNTTPGGEMRMAIKLAAKEKIKVYLIDQDIRITLKKISKQLTFKEKIHFAIDLFGGGLKKQKSIKIDLTKVPDKETIKLMTEEFKKRYPTLHKILILERNKIMAKNLNNLMDNNLDKDILAIVGAGHEEDILTIIKDARKNII